MIEAEVPGYIMLKPMPVQYCISKGAKTQACSIATWALEYFFPGSCLNCQYGSYTPPIPC